MKTERQFQEQESQWNENEAWYVSKDQVTNLSEEQKHHQNASEDQVINLSKEQKYHQNVNKAFATNFAEE